MTAARSDTFARQSISTELLSIQLYVFAATLTTLTLGAAVAGRRQAGIELVQAQRESAARADRERQRIARDLHDSVSQTLFSLGLHAGIARHEVARATLPTGSALPEAVAEMAALAQAALLEMRASIFDLRGDAVGEQGLVTALAAHGAALTVRHDVRVTVTGPEDRLPLAPRVEELLFRIGQEAVTNAVKHSGSSQVSAAVSAAGGSGGQITLTVHDDGNGFDPTVGFAGHLGLVMMRSRTEEAGGTMVIESWPAAGTTVRVTVRGGRPAPPAPRATPPASVT